MARFIAVLVFVASAFAAQAVFAKDHGDDKGGNGHRLAVPELSATGAAAGIVLVGGAVAIALGRRRARKS